MSRLRSFARLAPEDRRLVLRAAFALLASRLRGGVEPRRTNRAGSVNVARAQHIATVLVRTAGAVPFSTSCLERANALASLLAREGIGCDVRIAVRRDAASVEAHAWVEHDGVELLAPADEDFVAFEEKL